MIQQNQGTATGRQEGGPAALRRQAQMKSAAVRDAMRSLLTFASAGARDLKRGSPWGENLARFESLSMEQAKILATFPFGPDDPDIGPQLRRAGANFIAFRETVRRDVIGGINAATEPARLDVVMASVENWATLVTNSLDALEARLKEL